jgi:hypothetical protein
LFILQKSSKTERITNLRKRVFSEVEKKYDINYNHIINDIATNGADKNAIQVNIFPQPIKDGYDFPSEDNNSKQSTQSNSSTKFYRPNTKIR